MKRFSILTALIAVFALATLLAGCQQAPAETTAAPTKPQKPQLSIYYNTQMGTARKAQPDGTYKAQFLKDGKELVEIIVPNKEMMEQIDVLDIMGLKLDEKDQVKEIVRMINMPYQRLAWNYYVASASADQLVVNSDKTFRGKEIKVPISADIPVLNMSEYAAIPGEKADIVPQDCVTVVADDTGKILYIFISQRLNFFKTEIHYCEHCKKDMEFKLWDHKNTIPVADGHYRLATDVNLSSSFTINSGANICLDLNGKTVQQMVNGNRIYHLYDAQFNLMDSVGTGVMKPSYTSTAASNAHKWGMIFEMNHDDAVLRIYSGTLDASGQSAQYGNCVNQNKGYVAMYGGTMKGGQAYGTGSSTIGIGGVFDFYGGTLIGGTNFDEGYVSQNIHGGATLRVGADGVMNMYGGIITGGESDFDGGAMRVLGVLNMKGGTITGGKCKGVGGGIYVMEGGSVILSGTAKITDNEGTNLYLSNGSNLTVKELTPGDSGAKIGISMENPGLVSVGKVSAETASCFVSDDPSLTLTQNAEGQLVLG